MDDPHLAAYCGVSCAVIFTKIISISGLGFRKGCHHSLRLRCHLTLSRLGVKAFHKVVVICVDIFVLQCCRNDLLGVF